MKNTQQLILSIIFLSLFVLNISAQNLPRKVSFGAALKPVDTGLRIDKVFQGTNAHSWGLQEGDILISIDNKSFKNVLELIEDLKNWKDSEYKHIKYSRNSKVLEDSVKVYATPKEVSIYGNTIYGEVPFDGGYLRSILTIPVSKFKNPPVIFFMQGVGCASIDFHNNYSSTIKLLIDGLVEQGIAVYRIEKPGMGDSNNKTKCKEMDYDLELEAFNAGLETLINLKSSDGKNRFDKDEIFLFGESLSSITAPYLALRHKVAGIINWGGIAGTWYDYYMSLQVNQKRLMGFDQNYIDENYKKLLPFYKEYLINDLTPEQLKQKGYAELVEKYFREDDTWAGLHHYSYFQNLNKRNSLDAYSKINCKVLSLAGKHDIHAASTQWAIDITNAVNATNKDYASYVLLPKTTHHYYEIPSIQVYNRMRKANEIDAKYMAENFDYDIPVIIAEWIKKLHSH